MKKRTFVVSVLTFVLALVLAACGANSAGGGSTTTDDPSVKGEGVMTYADYAAADIDSAVTIECYVQGKQSWWDNKATIYAADADGAYFIYNAACSEEDYAKLVDGQKIKVEGFKTEWSGEVEVAEGSTITILDGNYIAPATDVTDKLGSDDLINFQNQKVTFTGLTIAPSTDPDGKEVAYLYNWDGSGAQGDDLYFNVSDGKATYSFTVESYLTDQNSDVYKAVEALNVGDTVDLEGFLYWYEGANPHITSVTVK